MTKPNSVRGSSSDGRFCEPGSVPSSVFVWPKGVCTLCTGGFLGLHFGPFPLPLSAILCCRQRDLAARAVGVVGRFGFSGNVSGGVCGRRTIRRQSPGVWDSDSSSRAGPGLVDPSDPTTLRRASCTCLSESALQRLRCGADERKVLSHKLSALQVIRNEASCGPAKVAFPSASYTCPSWATHPERPFSAC